MDSDNVTLYTEGKVLVFSTHPEQEHDLSVAQEDKQDNSKDQEPLQAKRDQEEAKIVAYNSCIEELAVHREFMETQLISLIDNDKDLSKIKAEMMNELKELYDKEDQYYLQVQESEKVLKGLQLIPKEKPLRGTFIKTMENSCAKDNKNKICYDHRHQLFYQFNLKQQYNKCILPSLITIGYDYNHYMTNKVFQNA